MRAVQQNAPSGLSWDGHTAVWDAVEGARLVQAFAVRVPLAIVFSSMPGTSLFFIGLAYPIASVVGIVLCLGYLKTGRWRKGLEEFEHAS